MGIISVLFKWITDKYRRRSVFNFVNLKLVFAADIQFIEIGLIKKVLDLFNGISFNRLDELADVVNLDSAVGGNNHGPGKGFDLNGYFLGNPCICILPVSEIKNPALVLPFRLVFQIQPQIVQIAGIVEKGGFLEEQGLFLRLIQVKRRDYIFNRVDDLRVGRIEDELFHGLVSQFDNPLAALPKVVDRMFFVVMVEL